MTSWTGVLGGTFDPVHCGHLQIAEAVRSVFSLERVLFVPCSIPPHKPGRPLTDASHRLAMLDVALAGHDAFESSAVELQRGGVSYTIDTLRTLRAVPLFIMGMDSLIDLESWRAPRELLDEFDVVVLDRPGSPNSRLPRWIAGRLQPVAPRPGAGERALSGRARPGGALLRVELAPVPISASDVRRRARNGESLDGLVPPEVARYIRRESLYTTEETR